MHVMSGKLIYMVDKMALESFKDEKSCTKPDQSVYCFHLLCRLLADALFRDPISRFAVRHIYFNDCHLKCAMMSQFRHSERESHISYSKCKLII